MRRRALVVLVGLLLVVGIAVAPVWTAPAVGASITAPAVAEQRVIDLVNAERAKDSLPSLAYSAVLTSSARAYAAYMASAGFFGHVGPDGSTLVTRNIAAGYGGYTWLGENLAAGQGTPEGAMSGWMASPGHRANILSPNAREIGVGFVTGGSYGYYWAQEFGARPTPSLAAPAATPVPAPRPMPAATPTPAPRPLAPIGSSSVQRVPSPIAGVSPSDPPDRQRAVVPSARDGRPARADNAMSTTWEGSVTGYTVSDEWLVAFRALGGLDSLGEPRSAVTLDPAGSGRVVQYFQRAVLEYHPENPAPYRIQRRLLGDVLAPGAHAPIAPTDAPPGPHTYFPFSASAPTGLGHFVADYTRSGQPIYFKDFFDRHGGVAAFGYPKEEPQLRNGIWTQRFQAAVFEYHPEHDVDGLIAPALPHHAYRVQLALLGDLYLDGVLLSAELQELAERRVARSLMM